MNGCPLCGSTRASRIDLPGERTPLYRCGDCSLVHWGAVWDAETATGHYHDYYARKTIVYDPITERRYHAILERFEHVRAAGRLLDVGCGTGHFLAVAEARGWQPVGLEVSASGVELLGRLKAESGRRYEVCQGDLLHADLPSGRFEAVTMFEVIEHLPDPMAYLRKIHALLEPRGVLYLTTPNFDSLSRYALGGRWRAIAREHLCLFTPRALRRALREAGFADASVTTKNVDVPEILKKWRARGTPRAKGATFESTRTFRRSVEGSRGLSTLKTVANRMLRAAGLGETLEGLAVKS